VSSAKITHLIPSLYTFQATFPSCTILGANEMSSLAKVHEQGGHLCCDYPCIKTLPTSCKSSLNVKTTENKTGTGMASIQNILWHARCSHEEFDKLSNSQHFKDCTIDLVHFCSNTYKTFPYLLDLFFIVLFSALLSWSLSTPFLNGDGVLDRLCEN
jgi:hypothetical protein